MPKPIGNLTANLRPHDKVSSRLLAKFESKSTLAAINQPQAEAKPRAVKPKYKKRKK